MAYAVAVMHRLVLTCAALVVGGCATESLSAKSPPSATPPPPVIEASFGGDPSEPSADEPELPPEPEPVAAPEDHDDEVPGPADPPGAFHTGLIGDVDSGGVLVGKAVGLKRSTGQAPSFGAGLSRDAIQRVIRAAVPQIKGCYQARLVKDPTLEGRVVVRMAIAPDGAVEQASITTGLQPDVDDCIKGVVESLSFPPPKDGAPVIVSYPFVFKTA